MTPRFFLIAIAASFSSAAIAQSDEFTVLDADVSGGLTHAELQILAPDLTVEEFAAADSDSSGELSRSEYDAWRNAEAEPEEG